MNSVKRNQKQEEHDNQACKDCFIEEIESVKEGAFIKGQCCDVSKRTFGEL